MTVTRRKLKQRRPAKARPQATTQDVTALARTGDSPQDIYLAFDKLDEALIEEGVRAIALNTPKPLAYTFPVGGKQVEGLSSVGIDVAVREMAKQGELLRVGVKDVSWEEKPRTIFATVVATRYSVNLETGEEMALDSRLGSCTQKKWMQLRDGGQRFDEFAVTKAVRKAQRNAFAQLLTPSVLARVLAIAKKGGSIVSAAPGGRQQNNSQQLQRSSGGYQDKLPPARGRAQPPARATQPGTGGGGKTAIMEFAAQADKIEKKIGKENFTRVLGAFGYETFQQVPNDPKVWAQLLHEWSAYEAKPDFGVGGSGSTGKLF